MNRELLVLGFIVLAASFVVFFPSVSVQQPCSVNTYEKIGGNGTEATVYLCPDGTNNPTYTGPDISSLNVGLSLAVVGTILAVAGVLMRGEEPVGGTWEKSKRVQDGE